MSGGEGRGGRSEGWRGHVRYEAGGMSGEWR